NSSGIVPATTSFEHELQTPSYARTPAHSAFSDDVSRGRPFSTPGVSRSLGSSGSMSPSINRPSSKAMAQCFDTRISAAGNDKWRGFGSGACQAEKTSVYKYPRFFKAGAYADAAFNATQDNYGDNTAFRLVELDYKNKKIIEANGTPGTSITHTLIDGDQI